MLLMLKKQISHKVGTDVAVSLQQSRLIVAVTPIITFYKSILCPSSVPLVVICFLHAQAGYTPQVGQFLVR